MLVLHDRVARKALTAGAQLPLLACTRGTIARIDAQCQA